MTTEGVSVRLFLGSQLTSLLKMHLQASGSWKECCLLKTQELVEVHYEKREYIGRYLEYNQININELKIEQQKIEELINKYCPTLNHSLNFVFFPQLFI